MGTHGLSCTADTSIRRKEGSLPEEEFLWDRTFFFFFSIDCFLFRHVVFLSVVCVL